MVVFLLCVYVYDVCVYDVCICDVCVFIGIYVWCVFMFV